jgi:TonB family protein
MRRLWVCIVFLCVGHNSQSARATQAKDNPAIIVPAEARNVHWADIYDGQVTYELSEPFPAPSTIERVRTTLQRLGWKMREYDFLNPTHSVAKMANWREAEIDGRVVTTWSGQWENVNSDVLVYGLSFRSAPGRTFDDQQEPTGPLYVTVTYLGAQLVRGLAEEMGRERDTPALGSSGAERDGAQTLSPTLQFKTLDVEFGPWVRQFVTRIRENWTRPSVKEPTSVVVRFDVDKQGALTNIELLKKAKSDPLNLAVIAALTASGPTAPLPSTYPKDRVSITATFDYEPKEEIEKSVWPFHST